MVLISGFFQRQQFSSTKKTRNNRHNVAYSESPFNHLYLYFLFVHLP